MRQMLAHLPSFAVMIDRERRFVWVNRLDETLTAEQVIGHKLDEFQHPDSLEQTVAALEQAFESGEHSTYQARAYGQGETETWYSTTIVPLPADSEGRQFALLLTVDVTERHRAEQALRDSESRFRKLTEASPDFIGMVDRDKRLIYVNRDPIGVSGIAMSDAPGALITDFVHEDERDRVLEVYERAFATGELGTYEARGALGEHTFEVRVIPMPTEGQAAEALVHAIDVTDARAASAERAKLEAQLQRAQRLETVGQLAGGVAHDFNNLLMVIQGNLESAIFAAKEGDDPLPDLERIDRAVERASNMTHRLLTIGRRQPRRPKRFELVEFCRETIQLLDRMMPESIVIKLSAGARRFPVQADRAEMQQVLINLCLNARDAIADVGTISVSVAELPSRADATSWVALRVADSGAGMDEATRQRAIEPFFTTKAAGKGSGLGLAMVHSIVTSNGGTFHLESQLGKGTTATLVLPQAEETTRPSTPPGAISSEREPKCKVLLAEDDADVRGAVVRMLERAGHEVIPAGDGQEAVELFRRHHASIPVAILDVVMPIMGGKDAYEQMININPRVRVLFSTGYAADALPQAFVESHQLRVIAKPYRAGTLLAAVREALEATASGPSNNPG